MNQTNNQQGSGVESTFSPTQSNPQTNPFTEGLKGEFTSNFGTNTNAVSQIFKDGNFTSQNRTKYILAGVAIVVILAAVFLIMTDPSDSVDPLEGSIGEPAIGEEGMEGVEGEAVATEGVEGEATTAESAMMEGEPTEQMAEGEAGTMTESGVEQQAAGGEYQSAATASVGDYAEPSAATARSYMSSGPITLVSPANSQSWSYDETMGPATFEWEGGGGMIVFSRSASMSPEVMRVPSSGSGYNFHNPYPGTWYWQVVNNSGPSEVRSFNVDAPVRRNVVMNQIAEISGNGGVVEWQGDEKVAFYRVEFTTGSWGSPQYRFATSGTKVQVQGMAGGQYQMRVGAFSEVSGRWEYTAPAAITVQ
ncbi:DUF4962 domain-containing protein [Oligoflexaceae bacterium]|nr:DUF4962 domain-containing protein [Oligoflexaceae bacterium]